MRRSARPPAPGPAAEPAPRTAGPRVWQGVTYRPSPAGAPEVRGVFRFAGAWTPAPAAGEWAWEAEADGRLLGGVLVERDGPAGLVHGPVVVEAPEGVEPLEVAVQLVAAVLEEATALGVDTLFARPQGLDRAWVRSGFVPMPEAALPAGLRGRPGSGLHVWRRPGTYQVAAPRAEEDAGRRGGRGR